MAEANKKFSTQIWLSEAKALLAEGHGGSSRLAEKLLLDELAAGRVLWGYRLKSGDAPDRALWQSSPRVNFEESSARVGYTMFFVGPGVGRDNGLRSTEWLGLWVARAHVLALLPGPSGHRGTGDVAAREGYQAARITRALGRLEAAGLELSDYTDAELRLLVQKQIESDEPKRTEIPPPSRQALDRVIRQRRAK